MSPAVSAVKQVLDSVDRRDLQAVLLACMRLRCLNLPEDIRMPEQDDSDFFSWLYPHVMKLPKSHPLHEAFKVAEGYGDDAPVGPAYRLCLQAFRALPASQQERILNGWTLAPAQLELDRAYLVAATESNNFRPAMQLTHQQGHEIRQSITHEFQTWGAASVRIEIEAGMSKREAMSALRAMLDHLDDHWPDLIRNRYRFGEPEERVAMAAADAEAEARWHSAHVGLLPATVSDLLEAATAA